MFSSVQQALDCLTAALDGVEVAPTGELRRTLGLAKRLRSRVELLETRAASAVAERERHGDGGAGLLNQVGGRSRSDAARNARLDAALAELPGARAGVADGEITLANAAKLAHAARKTSPDAVEGDVELVQMAKTLPPDEFAQAAQRWTIRHQSGDDLAAQHRRNRRNRNVRFWNGEDGSVQMRGSFDAEMGARIQQRLRRQAELLRQADRRRADHRRQNRSGPSNATLSSEHRSDSDNVGSVPEVAPRSRDQRMADALDTLLVGSAGPAGDAGPALGETGSDAAELGSIGEADGAHRSEPDARPESAPDAVQVLSAGGGSAPGDAVQVLSAGGGSAPGDAAQAPSIAGKAAEIIVRADLAAFTGEPGGLAEICGVGPIPPSTLERLACNSDVWIEVFGDALTPLYETVASRAPTAAQRRALVARDGTCVGCGAPPGDCEAHHITPCQRGGKTRVDNLVLVCWRCHDLIHDHNWQVTVRDGRFGLTPPDPAHPAERAPQRKPQLPPPRPLSPADAATPQATATGKSQRHAPRPSSPADRASEPSAGERAATLPPTPAAARPLWKDPAA